VCAGADFRKLQKRGQVATPRYPLLSERVAGYTWYVHVYIQGVRKVTLCYFGEMDGFPRDVNVSDVCIDLYRDM